jgi:TolB-like protein
VSVAIAPLSVVFLLHSVERQLLAASPAPRRSARLCTRLREKAMSNQPALDTLAGAADGSVSTIPIEELDEKHRKKKEKVRSAWISFVGRIVAQFVGASATFVLAVMVLQSQQPGAGRAVAEQATPSVVPQAPAPSPERVRRVSADASLAVLPLANFSGNSGNDPLASAITEALIASLSGEEGLQVISRTSSEHYGKQQMPLTELARQMGVEWIIEGSVVRAGARLRVTVQLIDAVADEHAWAAVYDRRIVDALSLQSSLGPPIAHDIANAVARTRSPAAGAELQTGESQTPATTARLNRR